MTCEDQEKTKNLRVLFEQHWLHCRHIETERGWFMNVYAAIMAGMLAFLAQRDLENLWAIYFLLALTAIGFLLTIRWQYAFEHHRKCINEAADKLGIVAEVDIPAKHIWKIVRTRYLFPSFYFIVFVGLILLFIWV